MKDLSLHLMDIIQNSITAKASLIKVNILAVPDIEDLLISIIDNGKGMDEDFVKKVIDPFVTTRTTRRVGLGIPLLKDSAEMAGGSLSIKSELGKGTEISATFKIKNIDRIPLGDIGETFSNLVLANPDIDFELLLKSDKETMDVSTKQIKEQLGEVPINTLEIVAWIKDYVNEGIKLVFGGVLDEITS